jgi:hypothetical protein
MFNFFSLSLKLTFILDVFAKEERNIEDLPRLSVQLVMNYAPALYDVFLTE